MGCTQIVNMDIMYIITNSIIILWLSMFKLIVSPDYKFDKIIEAAATEAQLDIEMTTTRYRSSVIYGPTYFNNLETVIEPNVTEPKKARTGWSLSGVVSRIPILKRVQGTECWKNVGCFSAMAFEDAIFGFIHMLPMGPRDIDPRFYLMRSDNEPVIVKYDFSKDWFKSYSTFNPKLRTVVITHGFFKSIEPWMINITQAISKLSTNEKFNYILVDWAKGSKVKNYALAASNTQVVGALISIFIQNLCDTFKEDAYSADKFYLIGHSLGAHTMGFAGKRLNNPQIARITGLDPAGPGFRNNNFKRRLHYTDASRVDVIHTDVASFVSSGLGIELAIGDIDFYPNGGKFQPDCPKTPQVIDNFIKSVFISDRDLSCSHNRAPKLASGLDNQNSICLPIGYQCDDWETFIEGRCARCEPYRGLSRCQVMGLYPSYWLNLTINKRNKNGNKFFLDTRGSIEYCIFHYQMAFHIASNSERKTDINVKFRVQAVVDHKKQLIVFDRKMSEVFPGSVQTMLITFSFMVTNVTSIRVEFGDSFGTKSGDTSRVNIDFIEFNYMSHIDDKVRKDMSSLLCLSPLKSNATSLKLKRCSSDQKPSRSALAMSSGRLKPFTNRNHIISIDFDNEEIIDFKITKDLTTKWFSSLRFGRRDDRNDDDDEEEEEVEEDKMLQSSNIGGDDGQDGDRVLKSNIGGNYNEDSEDNKVLKSSSQSDDYETIADPACGETPDSGTGDKLLHIWYFNAEIAQCRELLYRGYGGTANKFRTRQECEQRCLRHFIEGAEEEGPRIKPSVDHKPKGQKKTFSHRFNQLNERLKDDFMGGMHWNNQRMKGAMKKSYPPFGKYNGGYRSVGHSHNGYGQSGGGYRRPRQRTRNYNSNRYYSGYDYYY